MSRSFPVIEVRSAALVSALALSGLLFALGVFCGCTAPETPRTEPSSAAAPVPHEQARIIYVLPDSSAARFAQAKALAVATVRSLTPGDEIIIVNADFTLVASQVVPGTSSNPSEIASCAAVSVGGPSPRCQGVALDEAQLQRWRDDLVHQINSLQAKPASLDLSDGCRADSGWPSRKVLQLLLAFADEKNTSSYRNILILGGGDADARGDAPRLTASYLIHVEVVDAPYSMSCGGPSNLQDWFQDAASVRLFGAERPASEFPQFLFETSPIAVAGKAR